MKLKYTAIIALSLLLASQAHARPELQEQYKQSITIIEIGAGYGQAYDPVTHQRAKGAFIKLKSHGYYKGVCYEEYNGKKHYSEFNARYVYIEGTDQQLASLIPIFAEKMHNQEPMEINYQPINCLTDRDGVLFYSYDAQ